MSDIDGMDAFNALLDRLDTATSERSEQRQKAFDAECRVRELEAEAKHSAAEAERFTRDRLRLGRALDLLTRGDPADSEGRALAVAAMSGAPLPPIARPSIPF